MKPGDIVIIYSGRHYGRPHRIIEIIGRRVHAVQVDTQDWVCAPIWDCEVVS